MMKKLLSVRFIPMVLVLLLFILTFAACGSKTGDTVSNSTTGSISDVSEAPSTAAPTVTASSQLTPVDLIWYTDGAPQPDQALVNEKMSEITKAKINATITINKIDYGSYHQKIQMLTASQEPFDLVFTSSWAYNYALGASKGAFVVLDDLLEKYGQTVKLTVPAKYWDAIRVGGKLYGLINYQIEVMQSGVEVKKDLADKYHFDVKSIKSWAELEPFLQEVKKGEPGIYPFLAPTNAYINPSTLASGYLYNACTGDFYHPAAIKADDSSMKVLNIYETKEAMDYVKLMRSWYLKGYIKKDAASLKDSVAEWKSGKYAVSTQIQKPGMEVNDKIANGFDVSVTPVQPAVIETSGVTATLTAINRNSKNPERAMMLYDLMYSDKALYNLACFGIEGKHYNKVNDNTIKIADNSAYNPGTDWQFGCQFNAYFKEGQPETVWDDTKKVNDGAQPAPTLGFVYSKDICKTENAQIAAIVGQYLPGLTTGTTDPEKGMAEMNSKLKSAGLDKVLADVQKQLNDWSKSK